MTMADLAMALLAALVLGLREWLHRRPGRRRP